MYVGCLKRQRAEGSFPGVRSCQHPGVKRIKQYLLCSVGEAWQFNLDTLNRSRVTQACVSSKGVASGQAVAVQNHPTPVPYLQPTAVTTLSEPEVGIFSFSFTVWPPSSAIDWQDLTGRW